MTQCRRCGYQKLWKLNTGKYRCASCRYSFRPRTGGVYIPQSILKKVVEEFDLEHSTNIILERCAISKYKLLALLTALRTVMTRDVPQPFSGIVEVDETYLGGQWKNKPLKFKLESPRSKRGKGTTKQPVFGILCRKGQVWAELIDGVEADDIQPLIERQVIKGSTVCSDTWRAYTGIATKGYVHRCVEHGKGQYSDGSGGHINGLEGFWGYLKRKLAARGGIRREKIQLFLGEYIWRYNHRNLPHKQRIKTLFKLLAGVHY